MDKIKEQIIKQCVKCGNILPATPEYFGKTKKSNDGLKGTCKKCLSIYNKNYQKKNRDKLLANMKIYRENNKEQFKNMKKEYVKNNKEKVAAASKKYKDENKEAVKKKQNEYIMNRLNTDKEYRESYRLRNQLRRMLFKKADTEKNRLLVGCTVEQLRAHFESLFSDGMNWENHGTHGWHIDHIVPCVMFDLMDEQQKYKCFHYTNLQPLWAKDNRRKGASIREKIEG